MKALGQRKGKIVFNRGFLDDLSVEDLSKIFSTFFVISIVNDFFGISDNIIYYGVSIFFDEIDKGSIVPEYLVEVEIGKSVSWKHLHNSEEPIKPTIKGIRFVKVETAFETDEVRRPHKIFLL